MGIEPRFSSLHTCLAEEKEKITVVQQQQKTKHKCGQSASFLCCEIPLTRSAAGSRTPHAVGARWLQAGACTEFLDCVPVVSPELSGDALPRSTRGLVFTAVTVVTTVPQGITMRSFSIFAAGTGGGMGQDFNSPGSM